MKEKAPLVNVSKDMCFDICSHMKNCTYYSWNNNTRKCIISSLETYLGTKSLKFEYFCRQIGSTVTKRGCKIVRGRKRIPSNSNDNLVKKSSNKSEDSFKSIHYYIAVGVIIVLLAFTTSTMVSYRYSKRREKTPDPITVEELEGEPEELGAKKFCRDLTGT